jgi:hypothetical protein
LRLYQRDWRALQGGRYGSARPLLHAPENAEKRRRMASRAAKSKPNRELREVKALCQDLTERVLAGELLPGPAAVANQLINTRLRAIEQERKNKETEDLEARIEALERSGEGGRRWGT